MHCWWLFLVYSHSCPAKGTVVVASSTIPRNKHIELRNIQLKGASQNTGPELFYRGSEKAANLFRLTQQRMVLKSGLPSRPAILLATSEQMAMPFFSISFPFCLFLFLSFFMGLFPFFPFEISSCVKQDRPAFGGNQSGIRSQTSVLAQFSSVFSKGFSLSWSLFPGCSEGPCPSFSLNQTIQLWFLLPSPKETRWEPSRNQLPSVTLVSWSRKWSEGL